MTSEDLACWLIDQKILNTLLTDYLHLPQYVEKLDKILKWVYLSPCLFSLLRFFQSSLICPFACLFFARLFIRGFFCLIVSFIFSFFVNSYCIYKTFSRFLIHEDKLSTRDIDLIWDAQIDKHEAIVKNIHDLLAKLAWVLNPDSLDAIFVRYFIFISCINSSSFFCLVFWLILGSLYLAHE